MILLEEFSNYYEKTLFLLPSSLELRHSERIALLSSFALQYYFLALEQKAAQTPPVVSL
jgi:hypothetical protein